MAATTVMTSQAGKPPRTTPRLALPDAHFIWLEASVKRIEASVNPDKGDLRAVTGGNLALGTHGHSRGAAS